MLYQWGAPNLCMESTPQEVWYMSTTGIVIEWTSRWTEYLYIIHKGGQALSVIVDVT